MTDDEMFEAVRPFMRGFTLDLPAEGVMVVGVLLADGRTFERTFECELGEDPARIHRRKPEGELQAVRDAYASLLSDGTISPPEEA